MYSGVHQLTDGSSATYSHEEVQPDSIISPKLHLTVKPPDPIKPIIFNISDIVKILFFFVIHFCVIAQVTLHPHFVIVGKVVPLVWNFVVLPDLWVFLFLFLVFLHPINDLIHKERNSSNQFELLRDVESEFVLGYQAHNL